MSDQKLTNQSLVEVLNWRYAVKKFDAARPVSSADWQTLEESLLLAPSSYGLQPYKFVVVTNPQVKSELLPHAYNQPQIVDASHLVVFAAKNDLTEADIDDYINRVVETRGTPREMLEDYAAMMKGFQKMLEANGLMQAWTARQAYVPLGFLLESAALLGIDACPMEGIDPNAFTQILKLDEEGYTAVAVCALGYRDAQNDWLAPLAKVRLPRERIVRDIS